MSEMTLEVQKRETKGKNQNRQLRSRGLIPAVLYGGGRESVPLEVDRKTVLDLLKKAGSENAVFLLKLGESGKERHAMIRDLQIDPLQRHIVHIDFQRIEMSQKVRVEVHVEVTGVPYGVKNEGGVLDFVTRSLHVECLPGDIPSHIDLDVSPLHIGQHVEARQLDVPSGVTLLEDPARVIVSVSHARIEEKPVEEVAEAAEPAEPEVIKKGGKPEEEA
ncbi:MAG TPA: 50S ribosomal protein L25 [Thermoanaerobaculia bacterium]|nr:50S ribosomal protein L25 [Thermoanaerobaculia bacterium]